MADTVLFDNGVHRNILLEDSGGVGLSVQANQHLIVRNGEGMLLDPGGHKVYSKVLAKTFSALGGGNLRYLFLSHQDPDIVAAVNGWLMTTDATAYISALWVRFVPHFGLDHLLEHRLLPIPDQGATFEMGGATLYALPAHFCTARATSRFTIRFRRSCTPATSAPRSARTTSKSPTSTSICDIWKASTAAT